jgi:hypothetical protein
MRTLTMSYIAPNQKYRSTYSTVSIHATTTSMN